MANGNDKLDGWNIKELKNETQQTNILEDVIKINIEILENGILYEVLKLRKAKRRK